MAAQARLTLTSSDGVDITISRPAALMSGLFVDLMEDLAEEELSVSIPISEVDAATLKIVVEFCEHHAQDEEDLSKHIWEDGDDSDPIIRLPHDEIPAWDKELIAKLSTEQVFLLTKAANFLDIDTLLHYCTKSIANMIKGKTTEEMREILNIRGDFSEVGEWAQQWSRSVMIVSNTRSPFPQSPLTFQRTIC
ncbi:E3 ubiquitin ligase complex SCF subunit sconC [Hypoxylon sp. NC1633]|nr:E3 ubiquitin ligase complex SCF subunit sconC [Hypoxylon sp. NC1633]